MSYLCIRGNLVYKFPVLNCFIWGVLVYGLFGIGEMASVLPRPKCLSNALLPQLQPYGQPHPLAQLDSPGTVYDSSRTPSCDDFSPHLPERAPIWPAVPAVRRQATPEEWEKLKPIIMQLYMTENKTYRQVAGILRDKHQFFPT